MEDESLQSDETLAEESENFTSPDFDENLSVEESDIKLHEEDSLYKLLFDRPEDTPSAEQQTQVFIIYSKHTIAFVYLVCHFIKPTRIFIIILIIIIIKKKRNFIK